MYAMDYEWLLRAKLRGRCFSYIPAILANMSHGGVSDRAWRLAARDVALAQAKHLPGWHGHHLHYWYQILKGSTREVLERAGLSRLVAAYHARLSRVKKIDEQR